MREHVSTILMSLLLALIVWVFAIDQENPTVRQEFPQPIPIEVRGLTEGMQTRQDLTKKTVALTLRAPARSLERVTPEDFTAYIDLTGLPPGSHDVPLVVDQVNPDVDVINVQPRQLRVQIEPVVSKEVPVQVEIMDSPAFSYDWQTPIVEPDEVVVTGPQSQVEQVRAAVAEVYLRNAKSQVERTQPLMAYNAENVPVERVAIAPQMSQIIVPIVQQPGSKEVAVMVPVEGQPAPGYLMTNVTAEPNTVILRGSPEALRQVGGFVETPPISVENATGDVLERLPLVLPENVSTLGESSISTTVSISPLESSVPIIRKPIVQGLDDGLRATVSLDQVEVIVTGPLPRLDSLTDDDVQVILDLAGLQPGSHVVTPRVVTPEGIEREGVIPQAIEVTILSPGTPAATPASTPTDAAGATGTVSPPPRETPTSTARADTPTSRE